MDLKYWIHIYCSFYFKVSYFYFKLNKKLAVWIITGARKKETKKGINSLKTRPEFVRTTSPVLEGTDLL